MTNDNGWGRGRSVSRFAVPGSSGSVGSDRSEVRAAQRDRRAAERAEASQARTEQRAIEREAQSRLRTAAREERHAPTGLDRSAIDVPGADRSTDRSTRSDVQPYVKRRKSGALARTGEVQKARDTRHYQTVVDADRMRILAKRGASLAGLAAAFGVSIETVEAALSETAGPETAGPETAGPETPAGVPTVQTPAGTAPGEASADKTPATEAGPDLPW